MNPTLKYLLGRLGLFIIVAALLWPTGLDPLVIAMAALLASFVLSLVLLRQWRDDAITKVDATVARRRSEKAELRAALAGEDED